MDDTQTYRSTSSKALSRSQTPTTAASANTSEERIVDMLNELLNALHIPIQILSPTDLTPSLLVATLESLLGQKLPIPSGSSNTSTSMLKVQKIKLFLGVLETDVLQEDVGLSKVDPRKLAVGEWAEAYFVAKVLCMVGLREGLLVSPTSHKARRRGRAEDQRDKGKYPEVHDLPTKKRGPKPRSVSDGSMRRPTYRSPQFSSPELDTTSVFYAASSTTTRDTQATITSVFDVHDDGLTGGLESTPTTPAFATETPLPGRERNVDSKEGDATPSSVALSLVPAFQTPPPAPYPTRPGRGGKRSAPPAACIHDVATPSLLLSVEDIGVSPPATVRPPQRHSKRLHQSGFTFSPPVCSSANPNRRRPPLSAHSPPPSSTSSSAKSATSELDPTDYPRRVPVRYSGYIERVDEDSEIASYELSRSLSGGSSNSFSSSPSGSNDSSGDRSILRNLDSDPGPARLGRGRYRVGDTEDDGEPEESGVSLDGDEDQTSRTIAAIHEEYERTLKLLDERAKLLQELADLNIRTNGRQES